MVAWIRQVDGLVVEYSSSANTHPVGVRCAVPGLPPKEEYGGYPRICSNHLTGSGNSLPVRVSTVLATHHQAWLVNWRSSPLTNKSVKFAQPN